LRDELWSTDTFVEFDHALNTAVKKIRVALSDSACVPRFIETVPRRGYRFIAPVKVMESGAGGECGGDVNTRTPTIHSRGHREFSARLSILAVIAGVVMVSLAGAVWRVASVKSATEIMLAIAPFEDISADGGHGGICAGLREELTAELGRVDPGHLRVSAHEVEVQSLGGGGRGGQASKVDYVLRGSVRQDGRRVRVSVQLVRARDESYMWAENFDREWEEEITSESKLAADIVSSLRPTLTALQRASR
jgi:TolB-like protein